jgi:hypothetical protein
MQTSAWKWTGYVISGVAVLFLLMDSLMKVYGARVSVDTTVSLGYDADIVRTLGAILLAATVLYVWPRTALIGAILITAYLGGAIATHVMHKSPLFSHTLFGVYVGALVWAGLYCRSPAVRALLSP